MDKQVLVINAVHERDAETYWKKLKLEKKEKCLICGDNVTGASFSAIGVMKGKIVVCCERGSCFSNFHVKLSNVKLELEK